MTLHESIRRVLELADRCTPEADIPRELKATVRDCIRSGLAEIRLCHVSWNSGPSRPGELFWDRPVVLPAPKDGGDEGKLAAKFRAACRWRLLLTPEGRKALASESLAAASTTETKKATASNLGNLDAQAVAVFVEHSDWTKTKIAEHLGCHEKSLAPGRCRKLALAIAAYKARIDPGRRRLRGSKDADGNLEAWEEEEKK